MGTEKLPFVPSQDSGDSLAGANQLALNVVFDSKGAVRRRPVISAFDQAPSTAIDAGGIVGIHVTADQKILAVGAPDPFSKIYRVGGGNSASISPTSAEQVTGGKRPTFAETEAIVAIAAGGDVQKVVLDGFTSSRLGGSPPKATHVIAHRSRLLLNSVTGNKNSVFYSAGAAGSSYTGHETWLGGTSGDFAADARPGPVLALLENSDEVFAFGDSNVESFAPESTLDYARSFANESGVIAPYSVIRVDKSFAWLDHEKRFVLSDGRGTKILSLPSIQQTLEDMSDVTDCFGGRVQVGSVDALVWRFPTDGRTFVYASGAWSQWSGPATSQFSARCFGRYFGGSIVGTDDGKIGKLTSLGHSDLGERITAHVTTGFITHGTAKRKHCEAIRVMMRRGNTFDGGALHIEYRDDEGPWNGPIVLELGSGSDRDIVLQRRSLGTYRARQWRATFSGEEDFLLVGVEEDFAVLTD